MTDVEIEQAKKLREEGKTYKEIGDVMCYCTSMIYHAIGKSTRKNAKVYEKIALKGFYDYFAEYQEETISHFTFRTFGYYDSQRFYLIERMLKGQNVTLSIETIKKMCEITGKTFEELFKKRKGF